MPVLSADDVVHICEAMFEATGVSKEDAKIVGEHIARANLCGHDSHGIQNVSRLVGLLRKGAINPRGKWKVKKETPATALIDGDWALGQAVVTSALNIAIDKAKTTGVGAVSIFNCSHIGRLGDYTNTIAERGMIGMLYANSLPGVAAFGGKTRVLGTNPISYAFPTDDEPIMMDFATSIVAEGKVRAALHKGLQIPVGWILDRDGKATTNPADLYSKPGEPMSAGGSLLPAAGHKGYSLAVGVDILAGALTGSGMSGEIKSGNGVFLQAINIESFSTIEDYKAHVGKLIVNLKNASVANGFEEILLPGEPELRSKQKRLSDGIPIPESTWDELVKTASDIGVSLPTPIVS